MVVVVVIVAESIQSVAHPDRPAAMEWPLHTIDVDDEFGKCHMPLAKIGLVTSGNRLTAGRQGNDDVDEYQDQEYQ